MHPLMPLSEVVDIELPRFKSLYDAIKDQTILELSSPYDVKKYLLNQKIGSANMLFLQDVDTGKMSWKYRNGI